MPQIQKGTTYSAINNSVNFTNLNNLVDASILMVGAVSEQNGLTPNTLASTDEFIINDSGLLKKATASDILNSSLDATLVNATVTTVITSAITPATGKDLTLNPSDAVIVTGKSFNCINGFDVVVFSTAHGLPINSIILVSASIAEYSGTFRVISASVDSFQYVLNTTAVPTGGTCSYTKKASVFVNGGLVSNSLSVSKSNHRVDGVLYAKGNIQSDGVANFNGTLQYKGLDIKPRYDYFVQTRATATLTSGWGGLQNLPNIYGTKILALDITFTPTKAGNTVVLEWTIFGEASPSADHAVLVTRTPNTGVGAGVPVALPNAVDASNNTWSGIGTFGYEPDNASTPTTTTIKIVDFNTLDVSCTYSVCFRSSSNATTTFLLNRAVAIDGSLTYETGLSVGHAHEIYV